MADILNTSFTTQPEANQTVGAGDANLTPSGDGIGFYGSWATNDGSLSIVTTAANYSGGGGGRGFRMYGGDAGVNDVSSSLRIVFGTPASEIWLRYYIRYESGLEYTPSAGHKQIYINYGMAYGHAYMGLLEGSIAAHGNWEAGNRISSRTFAQWMGGSAVGDGQFHCIEWHLKMNATGGTANGILQCWENGTLILDETDMLWAPSGQDNKTWDEMLVGENMAQLVSGADHFIDFDDIVVSDSGYIGPLSGGGGALDTAGEGALSATGASSAGGAIAMAGEGDLQAAGSSQVAATGQRTFRFRNDDGGLQAP